MTDDRFAPGGSWERDLAEARADNDAGRVHTLKEERWLEEGRRNVADLFAQPRGDLLGDIDRGFVDHDEAQREHAERLGRRVYHGDPEAERRALSDVRVRDLDRRAREVHSVGDREQAERLDAARQALIYKIISGEEEVVREQTISDVALDQFGGGDAA